MFLKSLKFGYFLWQLSVAPPTAVSYWLQLPQAPLSQYEWRVKISYKSYTSSSKRKKISSTIHSVPHDTWERLLLHMMLWVHKDVKGMEVCYSAIVSSVISHFVIVNHNCWLPNQNSALNEGCTHNSKSFLISIHCFLSFQWAGGVQGQLTMLSLSLEEIKEAKKGSFPDSDSSQNQVRTPTECLLCLTQGYSLLAKQRHHYCMLR